MVFDNFSLLQENTHFTNDEDVRCEAVAGYEGSVGCVSALIESAMESQSIFESIINLDFLDAAAKINYNGITESVVDEYLLEAEGTEKDVKEGKGSGIISRVIGAIKKFWGMVTSAIDSAMNSLRVYFAKDLVKFVEANKPKLPSQDVMKKMKIKWVDFKTDAVAEPGKLDAGKALIYFEMSDEELKKKHAEVTAKDYVTKVAKEKGVECTSLKDYTDKRLKAATPEAKESTVADCIGKATSALQGGKFDMSVLAGYKKAADNYFKQAINSIQKAAKYVNKKGTLNAQDGAGNSAEVKFDDAGKSKYAMAANIAVAEIRANHDIMITDIKIAQKLISKQIAQAKALYMRALGGKADKAEDATNAEEKVAQENALLEASEYEVEMELNSYAMEPEELGSEE